MNQIVESTDQSRIPTIPAPAPVSGISTAFSPDSALLHRHRVALSDEIVRLQQELARVSRLSRFSLKRQSGTLEQRAQIWADLVICRSLLLSLGHPVAWVEECTPEQILEDQMEKRVRRMGMQSA